MVKNKKNLKELALKITQYFLSYKWSLEYKNDFVKNEDQLLFHQS